MVMWFVTGIVSVLIYLWVFAGFVRTRQRDGFPPCTVRLLLSHMGWWQATLLFVLGALGGFVTAMAGGLFLILAMGALSDG